MYGFWNTGRCRGLCFHDQPTITPEQQVRERVEAAARVAIKRALRVELRARGIEAVIR